MFNARLGAGNLAAKLLILHNLLVDESRCEALVHWGKLRTHALQKASGREALAQ